MQEIQFDYYHGMEAEQYTFYRIPKALFTAEYFKSLSCEAKVLYGLLLDRMSLSVKNRWLDEEDRVYIFFTVDEIMELMCCKTQKAIKLLKELDSESGIGLIEKKRLGLGKPNAIYVKNFLIKKIKPPQETNQMPECPESMERETESQKHQEKDGIETEPLTMGNQNSRTLKNEIQEFPESKIKNFENQNSRTTKNKTQEFPKSQSKNFENHNSGIVKIKNQEFRFSQSNDTDFNETDLSETEHSETEHNKTDSNEITSNVMVPIHPNLIPSVSPVPELESEAIEEMDAYRNVIRERISYECFQDERRYRREDVDELVELMVEAMMTPDNGTLRIAGVEKPAAIVKNRLMKLNHLHMGYILDCLAANTTKVGNIKAYLLTTLYNAPLTMSNYYQAEVNHDMRKRRWGG